MTPFEQAAARAYGHDMLCLIAGCPLERIKRGMRSVSHYPVRGEVYWMDTTPQGIALRGRLHDAGAAVVLWRDVMAHVRGLPERILSDARSVDHDAHRPPASTLEWHDPFAARRRSEGELFAYRLWSESVRERTATVLEQAFPEADLDDQDLFSAAGISLNPEGGGTNASLC